MSWYRGVLPDWGELTRPAGFALPREGLLDCCPDGSCFCPWGLLAAGLWDREALLWPDAAAPGLLGSLFWLARVRPGLLGVLLWLGVAAPGLLGTLFWLERLRLGLLGALPLGAVARLPRRTGLVAGGAPKDWPWPCPTLAMLCSALDSNAVPV